MKKILMFGMCAVLMLAMSGCWFNKSKLKPVIVKSYVVVNDTIGVAKQSPGTITNNVPKLIKVGEVIKTALVLVGKSIGPEKVKPYVDATDQVIAVLKTINDDPTKVAEKITQVIAGLEKTRDGIVEVAKWAGCEKDLPAPKANVIVTIENVTTGSDELSQLVEASK